MGKRRGITDLLPDPIRYLIAELFNCEHSPDPALHITWSSVTRLCGTAIQPDSIAVRMVPTYGVLRLTNDDSLAQPAVGICGTGPIGTPETSSPGRATIPHTLVVSFVPPC